MSDEDISLSLQKLIPSPKVKKLLYLEPHIVFVGVDNLRIGQRAIFFERHVQDAIISGSAILVLLNGGQLLLVGADAQLLAEKVVGVPDTVTYSRIFTNFRGSIMGVTLGWATINEVGFYDVDSSKLRDNSSSMLSYRSLLRVPAGMFNYIVENQRVTKDGVSAMSRILLTCTTNSTQSYFKLYDIRSNKEGGSLAVLPLNVEVKWCVPLEEGTVVLGSSDKLMLLRCKDIFSGNPNLVSCGCRGLRYLTSTRTSTGISVYAVCGDYSVHELNIFPDHLSLSLISGSLDFLKDCEHLLIVAVTVADRRCWNLTWANSSGDTGSYGILANEDVREIYGVSESNLSGVSYYSTDFQFDAPSQRVIGFRYDASWLVAIQKGLQMNAIVRSEIPCKHICRLVYDETAKIFYVVRPWGTMAFRISSNDDPLLLEQVMEDIVGDQEVLASGSDQGRIFIVTREHVVAVSIFAPYGIHFEQRLHITSACVSEGFCVAVTASDTVCVLNIRTDLSMKEFPCASTPSCLDIGPGGVLVLGTRASMLEFYDLFTLQLVRSVPLMCVPYSVCWKYGASCYVGYANGTYSLINEDKERVRRLGVMPISFVNTGEAEFVLAISQGLWLLGEEDLPLLHNDGTTRSLAYNVVDGACALHHDGSVQLVVAYEGKISFLTFHGSGPLQFVHVSPVNLRAGGIENVVPLPEHRLWAVANKSGIEFVDSKHLKLLKSQEGDDVDTKVNTAIAWSFEHNGRTYQYLVSACTLASKPSLSFISIERNRNEVSLKRRFTVTLSIGASKLLAAGRKLYYVEHLDEGSVLRSISLVLSDSRVRMDSSQDHIVFEGQVTDLSCSETALYVSTTRGLHLVDTKALALITSPADRFNRMRECICHLVYQYNYERFVLVSDSTMFLSVLKLQGDKWISVSRILRRERIVRMRPVQNMVPGEYEKPVLALLNDGSFVRISLGRQSDRIEPMLY